MLDIGAEAASFTITRPDAQTTLSATGIAGSASGPLQVVGRVLLRDGSAVSRFEPVTYAFNLMLDTVSAFEIERAYAALAAFDIPERDLITQYGPCATILVMSDRVSAKTVADILDWTLPGLGAQLVTIGEPCMIPGNPPALSLRVSPTETLLDLHNRIYRELPEEEIHLLYRPAHWQPHVKLTNFSGDRMAAATLMARVAAARQSWSGLLDRLAHLIQRHGRDSVAGVA